MTSRSTTPPMDTSYTVNADVLQQAKDVLLSYALNEPYANGRFATTTEIILAREVVRLSLTGIDMEAGAHG